MATRHQLMQLPGIGKQMAAKIMDYRDNYGPIKNRNQDSGHIQKLLAKKRKKNSNEHFILGSNDD